MRFSLIKSMGNAIHKKEEPVVEVEKSIQVKEKIINNKVEEDRSKLLYNHLKKESVLSKPISKLEEQTTVKDKPSTYVVPSKLKENIPTGRELETYPNGLKFMAKFPRYEPKSKDHTSLIESKKCLRRYFYRIVLGKVPEANEVIYFPWGSAYHLFRQRLTELYGYGEEEPKVYDSDRAKRSYVKASVEGISYWKKHGKDQKAGTELDWFTTDRLATSFMKAFEFWINERRQGKIKVLATEQVFNVQLKDGSFTNGRADEIILWLGNVWGRDHKTTSKDEKYFERFLDPNDQFRRYTFAEGKLSGKMISGIVVQCLYNAKSTKAGPKGPDVYEKVVDVTADQINMWEHEQTVWNKILQVCRDNDTWPMMETQCAYCPYNQVCVKPTEAAQMYQLDQKFITKVWDPSQVGLDD